MMEQKQTSTTLIYKHGESIRKSILAGMCIGIGGTVYLSCSNKYIGALLFGIGLFLICTYNLNLFTGKVGYAIEQRKQYNLLYYIEIWVGNLIGCTVVALPLRIAKPELTTVAEIMVNSKLSQTVPQTIILGMMCGVMMFIAVNTYRIAKNPQDKILGIFLPVMIFVLCGFEHSIANMCYMLFAINLDIIQITDFIVYITIVSLSNTVGSILFCALKG